MENYRHGLYFIKCGMTSIFDDNGRMLPVTVVECIKNKVLDKKKNNFLFLFEGNNKIFRKFKKPELGTLKKYQAETKKGFLVEQSSIEDLKSNDSFDVNFFTQGSFIDVSGVTKGKGFQGGMKRHGFKGGRASHGCSLAHRGLGSTGMRHLPAKTIKGRKMPGRMGGEMRTQQNLKVARIIPEDNVLLVHGSIPGPNNSLIFIRNSVKKC